MSDSLLDLCGLDIFDISPDWATLPSLEESQGREVIQQGKGYAQYRNLTLNLNYTINYDFFNVDKSTEFNLLNFYCSQVGMLKRFWCPIYFNMFSLSEPIVNGAVYFAATDDGFYDVMQGYERLYIVLKDGSCISRKITGAYSRNYFTINGTFDRNIALTDISLFGRLILCRFDQDVLEVSHETDDKSYCSIKVKELAKEYALV